MKRSAIVLSLIILFAGAFGFTTNKTAEENALPLVVVHIMQAGNCGVGQVGAKVKFRDLTTNTLLCEVNSGTDGYASCTAAPGHLISVYATYGNNEACAKMTQDDDGIDMGYLCLGPACMEK